MRAGDRNRRIVLRRAANATDDYGGRVTIWANLATVWAQHLPLSDGERVRAAQMGATATDRFRVLKGGAWADLTDAPPERADAASHGLISSGFS